MSTEQKKEVPVDEAAEINEVEGSEEAAEAVAGDDAQTPEGDSSLESELYEAHEEIAELNDKLLRLAADYENYKRRNERERTQIMKYAGEHIFKELLPVVDNLERAINQGVVDGVDAEQNLKALLEGVELTLKCLTAGLSKFEVKPIESVGESFDPNKQEAMTMEHSDTVPANHIITEFEKGYFYKDRLLRAAKVIVSAGKADD